MRKIKVLVVDDSVFMRKLITRLIEEDNELQVIGTAKNGLEAVSMVTQLKPDVVTLDIEMPEMNGLEALVKIMRLRPTPILILSSLTQEGAQSTVEALHNGAIDFIAKPSGSLSTDLYKVKNELLSKIKLAAQTPLKSLMRSLTPQQAPKKVPRSVITNSLGTISAETDHYNQILAIGTSTGGPKALETVITALPPDFPYPILVVQHMPPNFTKSLAQRLDRLSQVRVVEAKDNQHIVGGTVYIAPGDYHMTAALTNHELRIHLHQQPPCNGHRPSVDVLFDSVSQLHSLKRHYVLMTGMGNDGARGMESAKQAGASSTIAESKETCIVYGMPRSAIERGCVDHTVPLPLIAAKIGEVMKEKRRSY